MKKLGSVILFTSALLLGCLSLAPTSSVPFLITNGKLTNTLNANNQTISNFNSSGITANPTSSVGLTVVNGSANTLMRSDAAPPLDQTISPIWRGQHIWEFDNLLNSPDDTKGVLLQNTSASSSGSKVQISPELRLRGRLYSSSVDRSMDFRMYAAGSTSASFPAPTINIDYSANGGAYSTMMQLGWNGSIYLGGTVSTLPCAGCIVTTGSVSAGNYFASPQLTVSTLSNTAPLGAIAAVTDGDASLAIGVTVINSGAGATPYLCWYNGSAWKVMAK